ncbi:MAG: methylenetetrahydrofolate reductase [Agromyces sp.]
MTVVKPISFELFPPRSDAAALALGRTIDRLAEVNPAFFSVTFGAGGSNRDQSLTVLRYILEHTSVHAMAHLTCIGSTQADAERLVGEFLDAGVTSFLALRGDPPEDGSGDIGELASAADLVDLILHSQRVRDTSTSVQVAVAAFPNGHPRDVRPNQDLDALLAKEHAGATLAITQLFWHAEDYHGFVERARAHGVTIDILPGIMPVTSLGRLNRLEELTGVPAPADLVHALTSEDAADAGIDYAAELVREVLTIAPGAHLYTFNQHETVLETLRRV